MIKILVAAAIAAIAGPGHADTIYLCKAYAGGTFWTNGTCSSQSAHIDRIATVPGSMPFAEQVRFAMAQKAAAEPAPPAVVHNVTVNNPRLGTKAVCDSLSAEVTRLDAMARQPQSGRMQDWIKAERKSIRDEQFSLKC